MMTAKSRLEFGLREVNECYVLNGTTLENMVVNKADLWVILSRQSSDINVTAFWGATSWE